MDQEEGRPTAYGHFSVCMANRDHLRKVNEKRVAVLCNEDVELVEVAVDQARLGQPNNEIHQLTIQLPRLVDTLNLLKWVRRQKTHYNAVSVVINGRRHREAMSMQDLEESVFLRSGQLGELEPRRRLAVVKVVARVPDVSERSPAEAMHLEDALRPEGVGHEVDVCVCVRRWCSDGWCRDRGVRTENRCSPLSLPTPICWPTEYTESRLDIVLSAR